MRIIDARVHGILDYVVVLAFLAAPQTLGLTGLPATISYALAAVHLVVTLVTDFPMGAVKFLPLPWHGWIELAVAPTLVALPWALGFSDVEVARNFYVGAGLVIFVTWLVTDYRAPNSSNPISK